MSSIKKGIETELEIESLTFGGRGLARRDGLVIFVDNALPGARVKAKITKKRKDYAEARVLETLQASPEAVAPKCQHFGECGGCSHQNLKYEAQLKYKKLQVEESLIRLGGFTQPCVHDTLPSPEQFYYRNKMEFSFGTQRWLTQEEIENNSIIKPRDFALGLHVRGRFDKILDLDNCYLPSPNCVDILHFVRQFALDSKIPPYSTQTHSGFWRHLVIREGKNTGQIMVNIVTADVVEHFPVVDRLAEELHKNFPRITTVVHNINRRKAQVALGDEERVLWGPGFILEKIGAKQYQISANSFFQTNTRATELLYEQVVNFAHFTGREQVYDLYCGAGTIALYIADRVSAVTGFELMESAIQDAHKNAEINNIRNCTFVQGDLKELLADPSLACHQYGKPDLMIIDPPRAGMHPRVVQQVMKLNARKIIYVSCNPTTFARDARMLCEGGYQLREVQPVDMFPHTAHIELVGWLQKA